MVIKQSQNLKHLLCNIFLGALPAFSAIVPSPPTVPLSGCCQTPPSFQDTLEDIKHEFPGHVMTMSPLHPTSPPPIPISYYVIEINEKLSSILQRPPLEILKTIETQILFANRTYQDQRLLIPSLPIEGMQDKLSAQKICEDRSQTGYFQLSFDAKNPHEILQTLSFIPCHNNTVILQTSHAISPTELISDKPVESLHQSWAPLYTPPISLFQKPKIYLVNLQLQSSYPKWLEQYTALSSTLSQLSFIESVSIYQISTAHKTVQLQVKSMDKNDRQKLTKHIISFCETHLSTCRVAVEENQTQELWRVSTN